MNVLVLGMGSNVSQGIAKALRRINGIPIKLIGACISRTSVGLYLCDEALIMPKAADEDFIPWYIRTCKEFKIDISFTGVEENIAAIVKNREIIEKSCKTVFIYPEQEIWDIGFDKLRTCQWLQSNNIPFPDYAQGSDDEGIAKLIARVGFPVIAKPRSGKSSAGIILAKSLKDLMPIYGRDDYVIQECVGDADSEYTVGCYFSKEGKLISSIILHRYLRKGSTSMAEISHNNCIDEVVNKIAKRISIKGPLNMQMRLRADGEPVCFEWNVRYSGATAMRSYFGFCDVEAAIREYILHESIESCFNVADSGMSVRVEDEIYFDNISFNEKYAVLKI